MIRLPKTHSPPLACDVAGFLLGFAGLLLFFLPILGIPLSACGVILSLIGVGQAWSGGTASRRWAAGGLLLAGAALTVNLGLIFAPGDYRLERGSPRPWLPVPDRPYVPPPGRPLHEVGLD
jgi:hypothetical protein